MARQILRLAEEHHVLAADQPIGSSGGGRTEWVEIAPGATVDLAFSGMRFVSPASRSGQPVKVTAFSGLRVQVVIKTPGSGPDIVVQAKT